MATACGTQEPAPFNYLHVVELSDGERAQLYSTFKPKIAAAVGGGGVVVSEPMAVFPPGAPKDAEPGPVDWEIQMPAVDYITGQSYVARLGADRQRFVLEKRDGAAPLTNEEADRAFEVANADAKVQAIVANARAAGYRIEQGVMSLQPSDTCPGRCADVKFLGFGSSPELYSLIMIVDARVSLGTGGVVAYQEYAWMPQHD
jgi:hypothetical protein